jgi:hypothetical protein
MAENAQIKRETEVPGEGTTNVVIVVVVVVIVDLQAISIKVANADAAARSHLPFATALLRHHRSKGGPFPRLNFIRARRV